VSTTAARRPIVILISGRGSNMLALIERSCAADSPYRVAAVLSDNADAPGLRAARDLGIATEAIAPAAGEGRAAYDRRLAATIARHSPVLVVLAGFMRILSAPFVDEFAGRLLNIHPSLLPKYPGLHTHRRVLAAGEKEHGATVHFVTAALDAGPAVIQARLTILPSEDEAHLAARVQTLEHEIYPRAVRWFSEGRLSCHDGKAWLDGTALEAPVQPCDVETE